MWLLWATLQDWLLSFVSQPVTGKSWRSLRLFCWSDICPRLPRNCLSRAYFCLAAVLRVTRLLESLKRFEERTSVDSAPSIRRTISTKDNWLPLAGWSFHGWHSRLLGQEFIRPLTVFRGVLGGKCRVLWASSNHYTQSEVFETITPQSYKCRARSYRQGWLLFCRPLGLASWSDNRRFLTGKERFPKAGCADTVGSSCGTQ